MKLLATLLTATCLTTISANATLIRFIEFTIEQGTGGIPLHVGEVEAFMTGVTPGAGLDGINDLALTSKGASATTVSGDTFHGANGNLINGSASRGIDTWTRRTATIPAVGGVVGQVDLGGTFDIVTVRIWQRGDGCCQERLSNFTVNFYADNGTGGVGALVDSIAYPGQVPTNGFATFSQPAAVPEPSSSALLGLGGLALILRRRK
ncbi:hypothetical protein NT6N_21340 [Oceaniferula spumae]|uniref:Ice-binding protein C-terminal domain-containing protein n=1 Tax=Oceaniferula spumae TaxID=2979115 RepID=A0AAT9FMA3_9BACT